MADQAGDRLAPATLVLLHNGIGDYVMALPALRALCAHAPRPLMLVVGAGEHRFLLDELDPDALIAVPFSHAWPAKDFDPGVVLAACSGCACLVSLCAYACAGQTQLLEALRPARSIGFVAGFDERVRHAEPRHEVDVLFEFARRVLPPVDIEPFLGPPRWPSADRDAVAAMRRALGSDQRVLVVHNESRADKVFPAQRLDRLLAGWLDNTPGLSALVLSQGPAAWPLAERSGRAGFLLGMSLARSMAVAADADLFVGIDSCMLHVADFASRPAVGLFGPTDPARAGFRIAPAAVALHAAGPMAGLADGAVDAAVRHALAALPGAAAQAG